MSRIALAKHLPDDLVRVIYYKLYAKRKPVRNSLLKHFPDVLVRIIQSKLLPEKITNRNKLFQHVLANYSRNPAPISNIYCLRCNLSITNCYHIDRSAAIYSLNYNVMRIMSGSAGLAYST